jgi:uncharacterized membrane protein
MDTEKQKPLKLEELRKLRTPLKNPYEEHKRKLSRPEKVAIVVVDKVGTAGFISIILFWTICWLAWNTFGPVEFRFDPFPAFVLWLFISNMIQLFLLPMLLISQNIQDKIMQERSNNDYEVSIKSEREIEVILEHLEYQNNLLEDIHNKIKN